MYDMKKMVLFYILLLFNVLTFSQNNVYNKTIHRDFGTFKVVDGENIISVSAFVTIDTIDIVDQQKSKIIDTNKIYRYDVYMVSNSVYGGEKTSTWLYGTRIFINGEDVLLNQSQDGFVVLIKTEPTSIYTYKSSNPNDLFEIKWKKSMYEPRIRK